MIAIDTNVLARWVLRDDETQFLTAEKILSQDCWIGWTVLLELAWLLKSYGKLSRPQIASVLTALLDLPTVYCDRLENAKWAIERFSAGGDIADMIHIAATGNVSAFVSFDIGLTKKAGPDAPLKVEMAR